MAAFQSDSDLPTKAENDHFWIGRIVKFAVLAISVFGLFFVAGIFFFEIWTNSSFKSSLLNAIVQELSTIAIAGGSILGITVISKR